MRYEIENNESVSKATFALLDTHKIKNIGWKPQYSVKDGLKRTYMIKKEQLTNTVLFALKLKHLINRISREMRQLIIQIEKHHGQES